MEPPGRGGRWFAGKGADLDSDSDVVAALLAGSLTAVRIKFNAIEDNVVALPHRLSVIAAAPEPRPP